jgi:hypothetical protein
MRAYGHRSLLATVGTIPRAPPARVPRCRLRWIQCASPPALHWPPHHFPCYRHPSSPASLHIIDTNSPTSLNSRISADVGLGGERPAWRRIRGGERGAQGRHRGSLGRWRTRGTGTTRTSSCSVSDAGQRGGAEVLLVDSGRIARLVADARRRPTEPTR